MADIGLVNVLANGPSAAGVDPRTLPGLSIGMNAAYRFWESIDWLPDYYVCLDSQAIKNHSDWVKRTHDEKKIEGFFLHNQFQLEHPSLSGADNILFLDEVRKVGLRAPKSKEIFKSLTASFVTTGSWAIRYASHLGASHIRLIGFDLSYKKVRSGRKGLIRREASADIENRNYFFDGYQLPGDRFNVANPWFLPFELHTFSVLSAIKDVYRVAPHTKIDSVGGHPKLLELLDSGRWGNGGVFD